MSEQIQDVLAKMDKQFQTKFQQSSTNNPQKIIKKQLYKQQNQSQIQTTTPKKTKTTKFQFLEAKNELQLLLNQQQTKKKQIQEEQKIQKQQSDKQQQYQEDQSCYRQLSNKLQTALIKIDSIKQQRQKKQIKNDMHSRFDYYQKKKQKEIQQKRKQIADKTNHELQFKPEISMKSKTIVDQSHYTPIYKRYEKIIEKKKQKEEKNKQLKKQLEDKQYEEYLKEYQEHARVPTHVRSANNFYTQMQSWKQKRQKDVTDAAIKKQQDQLKGITFKPIINKHSQKLLQKKPRVPIHQRQIKPKVYKEQFSFKPKINKRKVVA